MIDLSNSFVFVQQNIPTINMKKLSQITKDTIQSFVQQDVDNLIFIILEHVFNVIY